MVLYSLLTSIGHRRQLRNLQSSWVWLAILFYPVVSQTTNSQNLILGIGIGTFIIIISIIFSVLWCLVCRCSSRPELFGAIGVLVPVVLIIAFVFTPKGNPQVSTQVSDGNFIPHIIFVIIALLALIIAALLLFLDWGMTSKKAKNIARSAFVIREDDEEQEKLQGRQGSISRAHSRQMLMERDSRQNLNQRRQQVPIRP